MTKEEIFQKLDSLNLDKKEYIIISEASLVCQDVIDETGDIDSITLLEQRKNERKELDMRKELFGV